MTTRVATAAITTLTAALGLAATAQATTPIAVVTVQEAARQIQAESGAPRLVLLYSSTCPVCRSFLGPFASFARSARERGVVVLAYSTDEQSAPLAKLLDGLDLPFGGTRLAPWRAGELGTAMGRVGIRIGESFGIPLAAVLDPQGSVMGQGTASVPLIASWLAKCPRGPVADSAADPTPVADGRTYATRPTCAGSGAALDVEADGAGPCQAFIGSPNEAVFTALGPLPLADAAAPVGSCLLVIECDSGRRATRALTLAKGERTTVELGPRDWR